MTAVSTEAAKTACIGDGKCVCEATKAALDGVYDQCVVGVGGTFENTHGSPTFVHARHGGGARQRAQRLAGLRPKAETP